MEVSHPGPVWARTRLAPSHDRYRGHLRHRDCGAPSISPNTFKAVTAVAAGFSYIVVQRKRSRGHCFRHRRASTTRAAISRSGSAEREPPPGLGDAPGLWWQWKGHDIRYVSIGSGQPVVLLHGFGVSLDYYRSLAPALVSAGYHVYALDWLGLGLSDKPADEDYSIELWAEILQDFCESQLGQKCSPVFVGNSIGSLVAITATATPWGSSHTKGLVLLNSAGGMNLRHMAMDDLSPFGLKVASTVVTGILGLLLSWRPLAKTLLGSLQKADSLKPVLQEIYTNKAAVDDALIDSIRAPAQNPKAVDVFVKILTGDPGLSPDKLMPLVRCPVKMIWGDSDAVTPLDGAYGRYFQELSEERSNMSFSVVEAGHCPHDDNPSAVNPEVLSWLTELHESKIV